jgi:Ni,Fe-hydrogenase I cytochrome b subunit
MPTTPVSAWRRCNAESILHLETMPMKLTRLLTRDPARHEGVHPLHIVALRVMYFLMCAMMARTAWSSILGHQGAWEPYRAMANCVWAAYGTLSLLGLWQPLRMLPLILFMIFYKVLWLAVVAYPLWRAGAPADASTEELTQVFLAAPVFALVVPWTYVLRRFVANRR